LDARGTRAAVRMPCGTARPRIRTSAIFSCGALERVLAVYAAPGSNILTVIPETFAGAVRDPEKYDQMRMGKLSEFFLPMFPAHQEQHQRRFLSTLEKGPASVHVGNLPLIGDSAPVR
jgi:hypothetical protein